MTTYEFRIPVHLVEVRCRVMVYLNQYMDHDLKQAMLRVSRFQNQYHRNNVTVKMHRMVLDPTDISIIFN